MSLSKANVSPQRIVARATAALTAAGALDPSPLRIDCAHVNTASIMVTYAENVGTPGGSPAMIVEAFDGLLWKRLTIDDVGTLTKSPTGTSSVVDEFQKNFYGRAAFSEEYALVIAKRFYAFRVNFFEVTTPLTPGTLGCIVILSTE